MAAVADGVPQDGYLKAMGMYPLTVPRLKVQIQGWMHHVSSEAFRGDFSHHFLASGVFSNPWCSLSCCDIFGVCLHHPMAISSVCLCV